MSVLQMPVLSQKLYSPSYSRSDLRKLIGQGYDGAATFSGKISGVHKRIQTSSAHAYPLFLSQVSACFNSGSCISEGDKDVFGTMTSVWKLFYYSPQKAEALKGHPGCSWFF